MRGIEEQAADLAWAAMCKRTPGTNRDPAEAIEWKQAVEQIVSDGLPALLQEIRERLLDDLQRWTVSRDLPDGIEPDSLGGLVKFADLIAAFDSAADSPVAGTDETERCNRCGREATIWGAPSPLWNAVMRGGSINGEPKYGDLVCATCFMQLAEAQGIATFFRVSAERINVELETTTPSGRVWDEDRWLWVDPDPIAREAEES